MLLMLMITKFSMIGAVSMIKHIKFFLILLYLESCSILEEIPVANYVYTTMKAGIVNEPPKIESLSIHFLTNP